MAKIVSGVIALFLLGLYGYAIRLLVAAPADEPSAQVATVLSLVGGLVSALVVAVLAITPPGESFGHLFTDKGSTSAKAITIVTWAYLFVWLACGVVLIACWMRTPAPAKALGAAAGSWLGLAVAAAYSYLGLKKKP